MGYVLENIINPVRKKTGCTTAEINDEEMLIYLNDRYFPLQRKFVVSNKESFQSRRVDDILQGNTIYNLPVPNPTADTEEGESPFGVGAIQFVYVDYGNGSVKATELLRSDLEKYPLDYFRKNSSQGQPYFKIFEQGSYKIIEIFPTPHKFVDDGLIIVSDLRPHALSGSHDIDRVLIPTDYLYLLKEALMINVYEHRNDEQRAVLQTNKYEMKLKEALNDWKRTVYRVVTSSKNKNLSRYE